MKILKFLELLERKFSPFIQTLLGYLHITSEARAHNTKFIKMKIRCAQI